MLAPWHSRCQCCVTASQAQLAPAPGAATAITSNVLGARTDLELRNILTEHRNETVCIGPAYYVQPLNPPVARSAVDHERQQQVVSAADVTLCNAVAAQVVVDFGSAFCSHCKAMLPHFLTASRKVTAESAVTCSHVH